MTILKKLFLLHEGVQYSENILIQMFHGHRQCATLSISGD